MSSSATVAPTPTPALLTSTSRRPKRSRWAATTCSHDLLVGEVAGDHLDLVALGAQALGGRLELLRAPGGDGQPVALLAQHVRDGQPDPARGPSDDRRLVRHVRPPSSAAQVVWRSIQSRAATLPPVLRVRTLMTTGAVLAAAVATAGCGSSDDSSSGSPPQPRPTASRGGLPRGQGHDAPGSPGLRLRGAGPGPRGQPDAQRRDAEPLRVRPLRHGAQAAHRRPGRASTPRAGTARACAARSWPATSRWPSSPPSRAARPRPTPTPPKAIYVADLPFAKGGKPVVTALARLDGRLVRTNAFSVQVDAQGRRSRPARGTRPSASTPRRSPPSAGTPRRSTPAPRRRPTCSRPTSPTSLGKKPVVLTFATPLLCQSRVCGPVVDVVEQVQVRDEGRRGLHPPGDLQGQQGQRGRARRRSPPGGCSPSPGPSSSTATASSRTRFEGAISAGELQRAVAKVAGQSS